MPGGLQRGKLAVCSRQRGDSGAVEIEQPMRTVGTQPMANMAWHASR
jgi:hypothetical protein